MGEKLNEIKAWFMDLPTPAKFAVIGAGVVLPLVLYQKSAGNGGGEGETLAAEKYTDLLSDIPSGGSSSASGGDSGGNSGQASNSSLVAENESLTNKLSDVLDTFQTYRADSQSMLAEVTAAQQASEREAAFLSGLVGTNIYMDSDTDSKQFSTIFGNVSRAVDEGVISRDSANYALSAIAGLGNNGMRPDGTPETGYTVPKTQAEISSEIARTKLVTQNRQNAGLDTSLQSKYMQELTKQTNTPPSSTNGGKPSTPVSNVISVISNNISRGGGGGGGGNSSGGGNSTKPSASNPPSKASYADKIQAKRDKLK